MVNIIRGTTNFPVSSIRLTEYFTKENNLNGELYIGYPIIGTPDGPYPIDAIWISREHGIIIFNLIEGKDINGYEEKQDDSANKLIAKLHNYKSLMKGRDLQVPIYVATFAPLYLTNSKSNNTAYPILGNNEDLEKYISNCTWDKADVYEILLATIQSISTIRKSNKPRIIENQDSRGSKLKKLEDSIANLDNLQGQAVIETVNDVQRIRGLAGSGKTIVLALKAAYLHAQHPDWKIAVTFNTRSLKGQFRQLINTFTIEKTNSEPDWHNLNILNAWGAPGDENRTGIYYKCCQMNEIPYYDFQTAKALFGNGNEFEGACQSALDENIITPYYNVILIDEAQDFPPAFLKLCYEFIKGEKRLIYAYDELQTLNSRSLPSPEEIFGKDNNGKFRVQFRSDTDEAKQDIILEKCYRNSRPILTTAHALGFGIYRDKDEETGTGLIQMFENRELWKDVGYEIIDGDLQDNHLVTLARTSKSSPLFLENHSNPEDIIQFHTFGSRKEQGDWVTQQIIENLKNDELRPDDIVVINPNPLTTRSEVGFIRKRLWEHEINSHLAGVDTSPDVFFDNEGDSIAFTGIFRAKGNEAGMVYIINAQDCYYSRGNLASIRNQLFTAITRSKAWVRVLGIGDNMENLTKEFESVRKNNFQLSFTYPTETQRKKLNIVHRDLTKAEKEKLKNHKKSINTIIEDLENGNLFIEDLDSKQIERLRQLIDINKDYNDHFHENSSSN